MYAKKVTEEEARELYAICWRQWLLVGLDSRYQEIRAAVLETVMDQVQPSIAEGPKDPRWKEFQDTLPGFREVWEQARKDMLDVQER